MRAWVIASACVQSNSDVCFSAHLELGPRHSSPAILLKDNIFKNLEDHEVTATLFHTPMCRYGQWVRLCVDKRHPPRPLKPVLQAFKERLARSRSSHDSLMTPFFGGVFCVRDGVGVRSSFSMPTCDPRLFVPCFVFNVFNGWTNASPWRMWSW